MSDVSFAERLSFAEPQGLPISDKAALEYPHTVSCVHLRFGLIWFLIGRKFRYRRGSRRGRSRKRSGQSGAKVSRCPIVLRSEMTPLSPCSAALVASENTFFCATTIRARDTKTFRAAIDRQTVSCAQTRRPVGSLHGRRLRSATLVIVYKDGFMTVSYFPSSSAPKQNSWIVQYIMPED